MKMYTKEELDKLPKRIKQQKLREYHDYLIQIRKEERTKINKAKLVTFNSIKIDTNEHYTIKTLLYPSGSVTLYGHFESRI